MPTTQEVSKKEQAEIDNALELYLKDNKEISDAIEVMKQADFVRNRGWYNLDPDPYRSVFVE